jgi:hypothetical protein
MMCNVSPLAYSLCDSGSYFVGFFLGPVALYTRPVGEPDVGAFEAFVVAAVVFTPFLFDTAYSLVGPERAGTCSRRTGSISTRGSRRTPPSTGR